MYSLANTNLGFKSSACIPQMRYIYEQNYSKR